MIWMQQMYVRATEALRSIRDREEGQGLVEYALILGLVSVLSIAFLSWIGFDVSEALDSVEDALGGSDEAAPTPPA